MRLDPTDAYPGRVLTGKAAKCLDYFTKYTGIVAETLVASSE